MGLETVVALGHGGGAEGVGLDRFGAGREVGVVDAGDDVGLRQHQDVGVALEVVPVIGEPRAAVVGVGQVVALHHRAHGPVQHEDAACEEGVEGGADIGSGHHTFLAAATTTANGPSASEAPVAVRTSAKPAPVR